MQHVRLAAEGAWHVLLAGILLGAGVPLIFALGVRSLGLGLPDGGETVSRKPTPLGMSAATLCFLVVVAAIAIGISIVVASGFGKAVSFEHIFPTFVDK